MKRPFLSTVAAAAVALALTTGFAPAQDLGLRQLQDSATVTLSRLGVETDLVDALTLSELTRIEAVNASSGPDESKADRIEIILTEAEARIASGVLADGTGPKGDIAGPTSPDLSGDLVLEATARAKLAQLGMVDVDVKTLTVSDLASIQRIVDGSLSTTQKRQAVDELLAK